MTATDTAGTAARPEIGAARRRKEDQRLVPAFMEPRSTVICSPVGSHTVDRGSMKAGMSRCWRYSRSSTMPFAHASAMASSTEPPLPCAAESSCQKADLLVPRSG